MRVYIALLLLPLMLLGLNSIAQGEIIGCGAKFGLSISNITGEDIPNEAGFLPGITTGGVLRFELSDLLYGETNLLYTQKGYKYEVSSVDYDLRLSYLEGCFLIGYQYDWDVFDPFFALGASFSFWLLRAEQGNEDVKEDLNSWDLGLLISAGLQIKKVIFEFRYNQSFRNLYREELKLDIKNKVVSLSLGFVI